MIQATAKLVLLSLIGLFVLTGVFPTYAEESPPTAATPQQAPATPASSPSETALGPVVVTAQKREQKLQDVPIAVTAFSSAQLEKRGIQNIYDLSTLAPGLKVSKSPNNNTISQIAIRGSVEINPALYWDPTVGIYLDGVYLGKAQGSIFDVVDLERIEVLRGPQGTLYGRNTIAGAINLVTRKPSGEFSGEISTEVGNYGALVQKASLDLPKVGIASVSVGARAEKRDGWVRTTPDSSVRELNNRNNDAIRLAANFAFSRNFQADYRLDHTDLNQKPQFSQLYHAEDSGTPPIFTLTGFSSLPSYARQTRQTTADINAPSFEVSTVRGHSLTLTWDINNHNTFKSISAYRHLDWSDSLDLDGTPLPVAFTQRFTKYREWSQELQLIGHTERWNYVGGFYYFFDDGRTNNPQMFFGNKSPPPPPPPTGYLFFTNFDSEYGTKTKAWAPYGQVEYKLFDSWTLTAGLRYTQEQKALDRVFGCNAPAAYTQFCTVLPPASFNYLIPPGTHAEQTFHAFTPLASVAYKFSEDLNLYARYAEGFKSGGFNGEYSNTANENDPTDLTGQKRRDENINETKTPFRPEKQKSFELGAKSSFANHRAQLNVAIFENKIKDLQESIFVATGAVASVIRNAGKATVRGLEVEGAVVPIKGTRLQANYAYLDAKYDEFKDSGMNQANNRAFVHAPRNTFNLVLDSTLLRSDWGSVHALADYAYTSGYYLYPYRLSGVDRTKDQNANDTRVKSYGLLNLRLSLEQIPLGDASAELALWCRNCTDVAVANNYIDFGPAFGHIIDAYFMDPRTFGVTAILRW